MRTIVGSVIGALAMGVLLIGYNSANRGVAQAQFASAPSDAQARFASDASGATGAAAGPVLVRCEPNQQALMRDTRGVNGELVRQIECVSAAATSAVYVDQYGRAVAIPDARAAQAELVGAPGAVRTVSYQPTVRREQIVSRQPRETVRKSGRSWKKSALIIGGSAGTGAGVGAIAGGKKGAAIGAAIGGGVATLYEALKR